MTDDFESRLRDHFHGRADHIDAAPALGGGLAVKEEARRRTAHRHRRRMATASIATAAAVAAGLVVVARDPGTQDISTDLASDGVADGLGLAAGAATGSSSGSSSGMPQGWTTKYVDGPSDLLPGLSLRVPENFDFISQGARTGSQGGGQAAADLAVAAEVTPGAPLRFVVASVQDATRLSSGKGGTETTINGRPARIISKRASTTITWDLSETKRVLVTAAGVDDATITGWLAGLTEDASGRWSFASEGPGGLTVVPTVTPSEQLGSYRSWQERAISDDGVCGGSGFDLSITSGGSYELWGTIADNSRWTTALPTVTSVTVPGATTPTTAFRSVYGDVLTTYGDDIVRISSWTATGESSASADELVGMIFTPTAAEDSAVVGSSVDTDCDRMKDGPVPTTMPPTDEGDVAPPPTVDPNGFPSTSIGG